MQLQPCVVTVNQPFDIAARDEDRQPQCAASRVHRPPERAEGMPLQPSGLERRDQ